MKKISGFLVLGWILLAVCSPPGLADLTPTARPQPTATDIESMPTPSSPGNLITWDTLQVTMDRFEVTGEYLTDFGSTFRAL